MPTIFVISQDGQPLMPTRRAGYVRLLLREGKASVYSHHPFTIQLNYTTTTYTQPIEFCCDTGDHYVGVSLKSEKQEFLADEYRPLTDEKNKHDDRRMYRRNRRARLRYRKPRYNNRRNRVGKLPPSIEHKVDVNLKAFRDLVKVCPITRAYFEVGAFDTQKLAAIEQGLVVPEGKDYQQGPKYNLSTLREACFTRDKYTCQFCGKGVGDNVVLRVHHALYWRGRHGSQLDEVVTCCSDCHTPDNHKRDDGKLWGYTPPKFRDYAGAAVMNQMRWRIINEARMVAPSVDVRVAYGAETKATRQFLKLEKSHVNDAYAMGVFHPARRAGEVRVFQKVRRNNRVLEYFRDAQYVDTRDGRKRKGAELSSGRVTRNKSLGGENLRCYRGEKVRPGKRLIRRRRYDIHPGDIVFHQGTRYTSKGIQNHGDYVRLACDPKDLVISVNKVGKVVHCGGYKQVS